ncbi:MAG: N-acetylmuramoyl-L-alanine amidase, partial [Clostridia bacterium]|nr:N-acetylmuramoyl-L-alanine amidase [Clostridia bacterium]
MRKTISVLLCVLMLSGIFAASGLFTAFAYSGDAIYAYNVDRTQTKMSVSSGKSYTITYSGTTADGTYKDDGKKLTDGKTSNSLDANYIKTTGVGTVTITIDLASAVAGVADFELHVLVSGSAVLPANFKLEVSDDGTNFAHVKYGQGAIPASASNNTAYTLKYALNDGILARYIRYTIATDGEFLFDEAAVYTYGIVKNTSASGSDFVDDQGLVYTANTSAGTAYVAGYTNSYTKTETVQGSGYAKANVTGNVDGADYYIGKGATDIGASGVRVQAQFIPSSRSNRPGLWVSQKKYVVVHNTGNYSHGANAWANNNYQRTSQGALDASCSYHYAVGDDGIFQGLPDNESGWHDSSGTYGTGNYYGIGMEVCVDDFPNTYSGTAWQNWLDTKFKLICRRAALLTVELIKRHNMNNFTGEPGNCYLNQSPIRQHFDVVQSGGYQKNCPMQMRYTSSTGGFTRDNGDMWKYYVSYVQRYWKEINGGGTTTVTTEVPNTVTDVKIPEYIKVNGTTCKVTGIAAKAFNGKSNLTRVAIPSTITWGNLTECFSGSSKLQAINVAKGNTYVSSNSGKLVYNGATITPAGYNAGSAQNVASGVTPKDTASSTSSSAIGDPEYVALMSAFRIKTGSKLAVDINKKQIKNIAASTSVSALRAQFEDSANMTFKDAQDHNISETSLIGTGATIT